MIGIICCVSLFLSSCSVGETIKHEYYSCSQPTSEVELPAQPACTVMSTPPVDLDPLLSSGKPIPRDDIPAAFSWKEYNGKDWTTEAKDQGNCGSCWDFAAVGTLESIINIRENKAELDPDLSEQYVLSCLPESGSCHGGSAYWAFHYIMDTSPDGNYYNGIIFEECMPYGADDTIPCSAKCDDWLDQLVPITDYGFFEVDGSPQDIEAIKTYIMENGPVATFILSTDDFVQWGLYHHDPSDYFAYTGTVYDANHIVVLVGWKDDPSIGNGGYWIVKNSWGQYFGYDGFFNIEYGTLAIDNIRIVWVDYDPDDFDWPPVAIPGDLYFGAVGEDILFDASASFDAEGSITSYEWDFGDETTGSGATAMHHYEERGLYTVTLTVTDESLQETTQETVALIDFWKVGDEWSYTVDDLFVNVDLGNQVLALDGAIDEVTLSVTDDSSSSYQLDFTGKVSADFSFDVLLDATRLKGSGTMTSFNSFQGSLTIGKTDLGISHLEGFLRGIAFIKLEPLPLSLPIPFMVSAEVDLSNPYTILELPFTTGILKYYPSTEITVELTIGGIFGLIKIPFTIEEELPPIAYRCQGVHEVTVQEGTYDAYQLTALGLNYYFAPEAGQIIKIEGDFGGMFSLAAELIEKQYS